MEENLKQMGFENFTGNLWKHPKFGVMHFANDSSLEDIANQIYRRGYSECQVIIRAALGIDK